MLKFRYGYKEYKILGGKAKRVFDIPERSYVFGGFSMVYYDSKFLVRKKHVYYGFNSEKLYRLGEGPSFEKSVSYWFRSKGEAINFLQRPDVVKIDEKSWSNIPTSNYNMMFPDNLVIEVND